MPECPKCLAVMGPTDRACPSCGHSLLPTLERRVERSGFAYGRFAVLTLLVGAVMAGLGGVLSIVFGITSLVQGRYLDGLVVSPLAFLFCFALLVAFVRVSDL